MKKSEKSSYLSRFSHIYVEEAALGCAMTKSIMESFETSQIVEIDNYKRVFNRPRQHFQVQKKSPKIIIAKKRPPFVYQPSVNCQKFGNDNFIYTTPALNCIYNCDYCYLQGMFESANLVFFVNQSDFEAAAGEAIINRPNKNMPLLLSISYDTDLMAMEKYTGYCRNWIAFAKRTPDLLVEIRTKSSSIDALSGIEVVDDVILAWSLAPNIVSRKYEKGAPSPQKRLETAARAVSNGWNVRFCFDPVIPIPDWKAAYREIIRETFETVSPLKILDVSFGPFRMGDTHFKNLKKMRLECDFFDFTGTEHHGEISQFMFEELNRYLPDFKIQSFQ